MPPRHLVVVPHSHWDREWYATHEEFRLRLVRLVETGRLDLGSMVSRHIHLDEVNDALRAMEAGEGIRGHFFLLPDPHTLEATLRAAERAGSPGGCP